MSEERFQQLEARVSENEQDIRGINAVLNDITQTMRAFAQGIVELRTSQQSVIETQRITLETVGRLTNTVDNLSQTVDNLSRTVDNLSQNVNVLVTQEVPSLNAAVERLDRIVDYLIRRDSERNGN